MPSSGAAGTPGHLAASSRCTRRIASALQCTTSKLVYCAHPAFLQETGRLALPHALPPAPPAVSACRRRAALPPPIVVQAEPRSTAPVKHTRDPSISGSPQAQPQDVPKASDKQHLRQGHSDRCCHSCRRRQQGGPVTACRRRTLPARGSARTAGKSAAGCRPSAASPASGAPRRCGIAGSTPSPPGCPCCSPPPWDSITCLVRPASGRDHCTTTLRVIVHAAAGTFRSICPTTCTCNMTPTECTRRLMSCWGSEQTGTAPPSI